jgi:serine/threonine protein kinase
MLLEFCDCGSLHDALDADAFVTADLKINYPAMLVIAAGIARGMLHLHNNNVLHSDLKASFKGCLLCAVCEREIVCVCLCVCIKRE